MKKISIICYGVFGAAFSISAIAEPINLVTLYGDTLNNNPHIVQSALSIDGADAEKNQVAARYLPQIDAGVQYGALRNDWTTLNETDGHGAEASVRFNQAIYNPYLNATSKLASESVELANISYNLALEGLKLNVINGYFLVLKAQENLKQAVALQAAFQEHLKQTKNRFNNGLIAENDVKEAQAQFDLSTTSVILRENDVDKALDGLFELSGKSYDGVESLNWLGYESVTPTPSQYSSWEERAQSHSPQMRLQRQLVSMARSQIGLAEAGHRPTLGLIAEYRYAFASESRSNAMGAQKGEFNVLDDNATVFAGIAMNLPIYSGGATSSQIEQAKVQYQQSLQSQEETWRNITRSVRSTEKDLHALQSVQKAYEQSVISAEAALQATEQGFDVGSRTIVDVLNSTHQLYTSRQQLTEARIDFLLSAANLKFLGGELTDEDIKAISIGLKQK